MVISLALVVSSLTASDGAGPCATGDFNSACKTDWQDRIFPNHVLDASYSATDCNCDLDGAPGVNPAPVAGARVKMSDFALLAETRLADYRQNTLVINEFMAKNDGFIRDPQGDYDDWIEIYNYGDNAINIGGLYLTDDLSVPGGWRVPDNNPAATTIGPQGYLLIWADGETDEGTLHASFKLSADGEQIGLFESDGITLIDGVTFGPQAEDSSSARLPDSSDNWQVLSSPTPGWSNKANPIEVLINEIMYHPYHSHPGAENIGVEYIELFNRGSQSVNLAGWQFNNGVDFLFPDITLGAGDYLVVAANVNAFTAKYPGVNNVTGGWDGRLSNSGETIELVNNVGVRIDWVRYADEGDWAVRELGPVDRSHRGWVWSNEHDGGGKSLELINPILPNEYGQNWAAGISNEGTPGTVNSVAADDVAPLILDVSHYPSIPGSNDPVTVTARIINELMRGITVTLYYRVDVSAYSRENYPHYDPDDYNSLMMFDDGEHGEGEADDGVYGVELPSQQDGTIVEFYLEASDAGANSRTWPGPSIVDGVEEQVTNLLYLVDDSFEPYWTLGDQPIYYLTMAEAERGRLAYIGSHSADRRSDAQMNGTFITVDGVDIKTRYLVGIRNRGKGTRTPPPNNYRLNIPHDQPWKGVTALNINSKYAFSQIMGSVLWRMAGLPAADATAVQVRVNGENLALDDPARMYGSYVALEVLNSDWADNHFPDDSAGNLYRGADDQGPAELGYGGDNPDTYRRGYSKNTNESDDDWTDLINLTYELNNDGISDTEFMERVGQVINIEQWMRYLAVDALSGNREGGLNTGRGDDYLMYRGVKDPRFWLVPHDLDTILGHRSADLGRNIFTFYEQVEGLNRLLNHPEIVRIYYNQFLDLIDTVFAPEKFNPLIDHVLGDWVPQAKINQMKQFVVDRIGYVLDQIPQDPLTSSSNLPLINGYHYRRTANTFTLSGTANAVTTRSVLVNGQFAEWSQRDGTWWFGPESITGEPRPSKTGRGEPLVERGSVWKYLDDGSNQGSLANGTSWFGHPNYNDSSWLEGPAELGYGDTGNNRPEVTQVNGGPSGNRFITTYFRHYFHLDDASRYSSLHLALMRDDGAVVYLNGVEVARSNMPNGRITYLTTASSNIAGAVEYTFFDFTVDASLLNDGLNVLAIEIHQNSGTSGDISFDLELEGILPPNGANGAGALQPGINRIVVQTFDGQNGTGNELEREYIDIWYDTNQTNDYPKNNLANNGGVPTVVSDLSTKLLVRDSYLPGIGILVRVEVVRSDGNVERELWDAVATLSVDNQSINLSTNRVVLRNGLGSALVTFTGSGDFMLTANVNGMKDSRLLTDLTGEPNFRSISGTLAGNSTIWNGIIYITDDLLVPSGHTLTIQPGTLILLDGVSSGSRGTDIDVKGTIESLGTASAPVTFTASNPAWAWGEIHHDYSAPSIYQYTNITRGGNSPGGGHTGSGPAIRPEGSNITFDYVSITDNVGKVMQSASGSDLTFRNCQLARSVMGPEINNTALLFEDNWITEMLGPDDNDGIYIHSQSAGQNVTLRRGVIADTDDDGLDTLGSTVLVEDYIFRDCLDKGVSVFDGEVILDYVLIVNNGIGISAKARDHSSAQVFLNHATLVCRDVGIQAFNKYNPTDPLIEYFVINSIILAADPVRTDYDPADIHIDYSDVGEIWPGINNISRDPLFVDSVNNDYNLLENSPCINAGNDDGLASVQGYYQYGQSDYPEGVLAENTIWTPQEGPYRVTGELTVPFGVDLTIMPGTTIFFDTDAKIVIRGRLIAEGTEYELIRFTRTPGAGGTWDGIQFVNTMRDNRITYAVIEYGRTNNGMVGLENSDLLLDHVTLDNTDLRRVSSINSSLIVSNCVFTDIFGPDEPPTTDNRSEHIWGRGIPEDGYFIIESNVFGTTKGHNDAIDFNGPSRPNPVAQILDNVFLGGGDDALDLDSDAHIEGNVFKRYHKDVYNTSTGEANVISAGGGKDYYLLRNLFHDIDHVAFIKEDSFVTFENNTVVDANKAVLYFDLAGQASGPGRGAYVDGSIFWNTGLIFDEVTASTDITVNRSIIPVEWHYLGQGNIDADPIFVEPNTDPPWLAWRNQVATGFHLRPSSPAIGAGPCGLDMGAYVPGGAAICGEPDEVTHRTDAALVVGGPGITHYKYSVNGGPWSQEQSVDVPIELANLLNGQSYTVYAIGKNSAGFWQSEESPSTSRTWTIDVSHQRLVINEVLAINISAIEHEGTFPDLIELYYDGPASLNLSGISITDNPDSPARFVFPAGTTSIKPGEHLVLCADSETTTSGIHLGFALNGDGEGVYLYDKSGVLLDSVEFGLQLPDFSIGRIGYNGQTSASSAEPWHLTIPTFGRPNVAQPLGNPKTLKINEWFANGEVLFEDDFIELFNPHVFPVELSGLYLTDNPITQPDKHQLGPLSFIAGEGFAVLDVDDRNQPGHVDFRLSADGEMLGLLDAELNEIDKVLYGPQATDTSQGRAPDGLENFEFFELPTPGVANPLGGAVTVTNLIAIDDVWAYEQTDTALPAIRRWSGPNYIDSSWPRGKALLYVENSNLPAPKNTPLTLGAMTYYFRKHFTLDADPDDITEFELFTVIDDGAVFYINGIEVLRLGMPDGTIQHTTRAGRSVGNADYEGPFIISTEHLLAGDNVIAVEVHQTSTTSSDIVFGLGLDAVVATSDESFTDALALLDGLRITELMYHASENGSDFDFVELQNISQTTLNLTGVRLRGGIDFTFPQMFLDPDQYVVVVGNLAAFQSIYRTSTNVAGEYSGSLSNGGENIILKLPWPLEAAILRFEYSDRWYPTTDGGGNSLMIYDPAAHPATWTQPESWQPATPTPGW